jgi:hypothetical protein
VLHECSYRGFSEERAPPGPGRADHVDRRGQTCGRRGQDPGGTGLTRRAPTRPGSTLPNRAQLSESHARHRSGQRGAKTGAGARIRSHISSAPHPLRAPLRQRWARRVRLRRSALGAPARPTPPTAGERQTDPAAIVNFDTRLECGGYLAEGAPHLLWRSIAVLVNRKALQGATERDDGIYYDLGLPYCRHESSHNARTA